MSSYLIRPGRLVMLPALDLVLLLSPAHCGGRRAAALMHPDAATPAARALQEGVLTLGEAFTFMSSLYFRGKLAYATAFAPGGSMPAASFVITPTRGLLPPETLVTPPLLQEFAEVDISAQEPRYRLPLERDLSTVAARLAPNGRAVLLGSIATDKYVDVLAPALGDRLHYPPAFIGRGDMSRGGLLLRSAASGLGLDYQPLTRVSPRHGARPPRLPPHDAHHASRGPRLPPHDAHHASRGPRLEARRSPGRVA